MYTKILSSVAVSALLVVSGVSAIGLYLYQNYMLKSVHDSLRHEVMLEVRNQLRDYHQLDEGLELSRLN